MISAQKKLSVLKKCGYRCVRCGGVKDLTMDHILPVSKGGSDEETNLQVMCFQCNTRKGNVHYTWRERLFNWLFTRVDAQVMEANLKSEISARVENLRNDLVNSFMGRLNGVDAKLAKDLNAQFAFVKEVDELQDDMVESRKRDERLLEMLYLLSEAVEELYNGRK